jgi:hypothetical protein
MREDEFKAWLAERGANTQAGRNTRAYAVRTIEDNLAALGLPHADLDAAWQADRFAGLRQRLKALHHDYRAGGDDYRILMPQSETPENRLANWPSLLGQYGQFLDGGDSTDRQNPGLQALVNALTRKEIDAAIELCDDEGLDEFLTIRGCRPPQRWIVSGEPARRYPAKAIVIAAVSFLPGGLELTAKTFFGGYGEAEAFARLTGLGYALSSSGERDVIDRFRVSPYFEKAVAGWTEDQREAFRHIAAAVHESGMDWWAVNNSDSPIRFGRKSRDTARAKVVQGFHNPKVRIISFNSPGVALDLGLSTFTIDADSAEQFVAVLRERAQDIAGWRPFGDVREGLWPDEGIREVENELDATPVWIVTALWGREDGVQRFVDRGEWSLLTDTGSANNQRMRQMQLGDRIVMRDYFHQSRDLPFEANGARVSAIRVRAIGTVTEQRDDGLSVGVHWETPLPEPRVWYFYTQNDPVWWLKEPGSDPLADHLRAFILHGEKQDYAYFLDRWFGADEMESDIPMPSPTNLILYGPPGTGKTYTTAHEAVRLCGEDVPKGRDAVMALYRSLHRKGRIGFVTFHQNFAYEDFVEGLRPVTAESDGTGFALEPQDGVFKQIASLATLPAPSKPAASPEGPGLIPAEAALFRMSLGDAADPRYSWVFDQSITEGYALFSFVDVDWSAARFDDPAEILAELQSRYPDKEYTAGSGAVESTHLFRNVVQRGDVIVVSKGKKLFRAVGIVEGDYEFTPRGERGYSHRRKVRWLWHDHDGLPVSTLRDRQFGINTISRLPRDGLNLAALERLTGDDDVQNAPLTPLPHVLIIDEINRANISKVFGELITLLEPDKRLGMPNALTVRLPYSKTEFGVPANLHIIGTMNTADRSIALLDTALRRRFTFREMAPRPDLLKPVDGIDLARLLTAINRRIEYLLDREHRIGHAFFMGCASRTAIDEVMRDKVIPLLQEYFFEDWGRIRAVLGGGFIGVSTLPPPPGMEDHLDRKTWFARWDEPKNRDAFPADAYDLLLSGAETTAEDDAGAEGESEGE